MLKNRTYILTKWNTCIAFVTKLLWGKKSQIWKNRSVTGAWVLCGMLNSVYRGTYFWNYLHFMYYSDEVDRSWSCLFLKSKCVSLWCGKLKSSQSQTPSHIWIICMHYVGVQREQEKELNRIILFFILQMFGYKVWS